MATKRFVVRAHFPSVDKGLHVHLEIRAGGWVAALRLAAQELKRDLRLKRKRIGALSLVMEDKGFWLEGEGELQPVGALVQGEFPREQEG